MIEIEAIGDFFQVDAQGYLVNPCSLDKIPMHLQPLLREIGIQYRINLGASLLGLYLRGSVPAGKAIPGISDLDILGLVRWNRHEPFVRWERPSWADEADRNLRKHFQSFTHFDHTIAHHDPDFPGQNLSVKMVLKTQSLCIWGHDVIPELPPFKLDRNLCIHQKWLTPTLETWVEFNHQWPSRAEKLDFIRSFCKTILRSGFEVVMLKEGRFTQDLSLCLNLFAKYHPAQKEAMSKVLRLFLNADALDRDADAIFRPIVQYLLSLG